MYKQIPLAKPDITEKEIAYVTDVLQSGILSIGPKVEQFEQMVADYVGVKHAIAVNSGTSGLHLIVRALGIGPGDEVITTPFSFIASANCILFENAVPIFVDIDPITLNIDLTQIEAKITAKTKAILVVDAFGQPVDMAAVKEIADRHKLLVIEDAAEALGSAHNGHMAGSVCDASVFAFYANKQITTAEGGMIVTNHDDIAELCRSMRSQGRAETGLWLFHERLGYNYRLSELHAALGIAQMERLTEILPRREQAADLYRAKLKRFGWIKLPHIDPRVSYMSWFVYVIQVSPDIRNQLIEYLLAQGISCKPYFTPIHLQPFYQELFGFTKEDYPVTYYAGESCIALPFYTQLAEEEIDYIVDRLAAFEVSSHLTSRC